MFIRYGELNIFTKKKQYRFVNPNKSFFVKLAWRFLFKKRKDDRLAIVGRCLECDANGDKDSSFSCGEYYCPCKWNEQLKRKKADNV